MQHSLKVIYSALFSNYEEIKEPKVITPGWQYILFTDQSVTSKIWEIRPVANVENPQKLAREFKIKRWVEWEESMWIDHAFFIDTDLNEWWEKYHLADFSAPKHPLRDCVYEEILACIIDQRRGKYEELVKQRETYLAEKVPERNGIITSGLLMRKRTPECIELCNEWWEELCKHSIRDQIAFAKASLNHKDIIHAYQWDYRREKDFIYWHHFARR